MLVESMKNYSQKIISNKIKKAEYKEKEKVENKNDNSNVSKDRLLTSSERAALMHAGDYCKLLRQNSVNLTDNKLVESSRKSR